MQADVRGRLSTARTALEFASGHPIDDPGFAATIKRLEAALAQADALGIQVEDGRSGERSATVQRRNLRHAIRNQYLRRLVQVARVAAATTPDLAGVLRMPPWSAPQASFVIAARAMLATADAQKDVLVPLGLGQNFVAELSAALDQFDSLTQAAHSGRSSHVGARAEIASLARDCMRDVRVLDTWYRQQFATDAELLASWLSASNLVAPPRHQAELPPQSAAA